MKPAANAFVLSPAMLGGVRGRRILAGVAATPRLEPLCRGASVPIAEIYAHISSLYFRGKLAYARKFSSVAEAPVLVITPDRGLVDVDQRVGLADLRRMAAIRIDVEEVRYQKALASTAEALRRSLPESAGLVLLGSIASPKYVDPLLGVFAERLLFPEAFVGRGDMSRGGLLLRAVESGDELAYAQALGVSRRGRRPARLDPATRPSRRLGRA